MLNDSALMMGATCYCCVSAKESRALIEERSLSSAKQVHFSTKEGLSYLSSSLQSKEAN